MSTKIYEDVKRFELSKFYDCYMGNFGFTENELFENMNKILMWLEKYENYGLIFQTNESYNGKCWWLTMVEC